MLLNVLWRGGHSAVDGDGLGHVREALGTQTPRVICCGRFRSTVWQLFQLFTVSVTVPSMAAIGRAVLANFILVYVYGARLAAATHGSERRVHFDGGGELPGVAMH